MELLLLNGSVDALDMILWIVFIGVVLYFCRSLVIYVFGFILLAIQFIYHTVRGDWDEYKDRLRR